MVNTYSTFMDFCNDSYEAEISYENSDYPTIYQVILLKRVTENESDVYHTPDGQPHTGIHWLKRDLTDFLSPIQLSHLAFEIAQHRTEQQAEAEAEQAEEYALERYLRFPEYFEGPMHFTGEMIT